MPPQNPQPAIRLIFEYDGDDVRLVSEQPVRMIVPDQEPRLEAAARAAGVYVDARDAANATIASVRAPDAFAASVEVFPEKPGEPFTRLPVERPKGAFTVVVPAPDAVKQVTVLRVAGPGAAPDVAVAPTGPGAPRVVDLATFPLRGR
jgi:hypothetical protein